MQVCTDPMSSELIAAFERLCKAMNDLWPHAVRRMEAQDATMTSEMNEFVRLGGQMRCVFHFHPAPALAFEMIDQDGQPVEFYRLFGEKRPEIVN